MKHYRKYATTLILSILFISCGSDDIIVIDEPIEISQEIKDLIYFKGEEDASTVLINVQSGPDNKLSTDEVDEIFQSFDTTDLLAVNVHQAQTLDPSLLEGGDITFDEAINYNAESVEMLYKVVKYFKDQGRTVYVLGISFGAFVTQELIAKKGIDVADNYLLMVGRLDIDDIIWQALSEGRLTYFENGITPIVEQEVSTDVTVRNLDKITAGLGMNRYTELLNPFEDLSNITYIYGETDQAVGRLTNPEIEFLQSKNVNIITGSGNHDETIDDFVVQGFEEAFGIQLKN
ncbi:hypothetical protein D1818_17855 [Aquimarina sp. BL5]|uniref:hypothetical protein n=1 Tax=Aquimarina sp. BL5 TaxID=1714860 RepID=UPI000E48936A|nr:hypothetical protein [Aquimarina sp. BL5]AXT52607.1 hypothetical protein D1818_17855 [Aquimarina sp. BL5]RKN11671.1 hypothetical protein D7036_00555 [Aquimarina sp. BL5]